MCFVVLTCSTFCLVEPPTLTFGAQLWCWCVPGKEKDWFEVKLDHISPIELEVHANMNYLNVEEVNRNIDHNTPVPKMIQCQAESITSVTISSIVSPSDMYLMPYDTRVVEQLTAELNQRYNSDSSIPLLTHPTVGMPCCAIFSDDACWYRGMVIEIKPTGTVVVQFVDYGNSEEVNKSSVRVLLEEFTKLPIQAFHGRLPSILPISDIWGTDVVNWLTVLSGEQALNCQVLHYDILHDIYDIKLTLADGIDVCTLLVSQGLAYWAEAPSSPQVTPQPVSSDSATTLGLAVGQVQAVSVTWVLSPKHIYCQLDDKQKSFEEFMAKIYESVAMSSQPLGSVVAGNYCMALYVDRSWYRAKIENVRDKFIQVFYLDYGNMHTITSKNELRPPPNEFFNFPFMAFKAELRGLDPPTGNSWPQFTEANGNKYFAENLRCRVTAITEDSTVVIELLREGRDVISELVQDGFGTLPASDNTQEMLAYLHTQDNLLEIRESKHLNSVEKLYHKLELTELNFSQDLDQIPYIQPFGSHLVTIMASDGPSHFICSLESEYELYESLTNTMTEYYSQTASNSTPQIQAGLECAALYSVDNLWYRAVVISAGQGSSITVYFLDYGNIETLPLHQVRPLEAAFKKLPRHTIKCSLYGCRTPVKPPLKARFSQMLQDRTLIAHLQEYKNGFYQVSLYDYSAQRLDLDLAFAIFGLKPTFPTKQDLTVFFHEQFDTEGNPQHDLSNRILSKKLAQWNLAKPRLVNKETNEEITDFVAIKEGGSTFAFVVYNASPQLCHNFSFFCEAPPSIQTRKVDGKHECYLTEFISLKEFYVLLASEEAQLTALSEEIMALFLPPPHRPLRTPPGLWGPTSWPGLPRITSCTGPRSQLSLGGKVRMCISWTTATRTQSH
ncbi:TDRD6 [Cordylochernes scorpioides]|uniref:TDRD6 n=1 Tax=Cordylochernes scorpioides TaxID=51811 RepID=A0ABY6KVG0_9ARAC|nr:TDRD6 [Cordylochernes scorpioides]